MPNFGAKTVVVFYRLNWLHAINVWPDDHVLDL